MLLLLFFFHYYFLPCRFSRRPTGLDHLMCVMEADGLDEDFFPTSWCHFLYSKGLKTMKEMLLLFFLQWIC